VSESAANLAIKQKAVQLLKLSGDQNLENPELAIQTAREALALSQSINDQEGTGDAYLTIGQYFYALNKMKEAAQNYELSLAIWRGLKKPQNEASVLTLLGYVEGRKGEWLNGFSYLAQAQNLQDHQIGAAEMARIAAGMGFFFNESGLPENGLIQYQRARDYYQQAPNALREYNRQVMMIGYTYFLLKNYQAALPHLQQALDYFKTAGKAIALDSVECEEYIAQVYLATGDYPLALKYLLPLPASYEHRKSYAAQVKVLIGEVYQRQEETELARSEFEAALQDFREADDPVRKAAVAFALGRLELNQDNYDAAENYLKESIETTEGIRSDLNSRMLATAFSASVHDRYESYIECLMRKNKQQPGHGLELQAFQASELVRARSLAALLHETQTKLMTGIDRGLAGREKTLRQAIRAKAEEAVALLATDYKREQLVELEKSLTSLREQHQQLAEKLKAQNPHYDEIKETKTYSIKQIQESIIEDNDTMLLEYFLGKNGSYAWAITRNDTRFYHLPAADRITALVQDVYKLLKQKPAGDIEQRLNDANRTLAETILTPLADHANVKRVIVVADRALNYIPFQSLPGPSGDPLVASYEIVNAPSASILGQLRQEKLLRPRSTRVVAAFGDPAFKSNYAELKNLGSSEVTASTRSASGERSVEVDADSLADPAKIESLFYSKFELQNLRNLVGQDAFVKTGFDASRAALETTDFSKFAILHFATHGVLDPENPTKSGFYLSTIDEAGHDQNGFISMQDVYNLRVPVALLVLSACRTALGKEVSGEGLIGLTRGFMHAGASSVVASLWKVDDEATSELMKDFYTNMLKKNMRPAEALREAQNTLRQNPQWRSPYYWAGFTFQGEFKEPIRLAPSATAPLAVQNAVGGALLLTLLAGIGWGYWRRRKA